MSWRNVIFTPKAFCNCSATWVSASESRPSSTNAAEGSAPSTSIPTTWSTMPHSLVMSWSRREVGA